MLEIPTITGTDPSLAWLLLAVLALLLVSAVVGALVGPQVLDGGAPGALMEDEASAGGPARAEDAKKAAR